MQSVMLTLNDEVNLSDWESTLGVLKNWEGVADAAPLRPGAKNPRLQRMFYLYLHDDADAQAIVNQLVDLPQVKSAELPPERYLIETKAAG